MEEEKIVLDKQSFEALAVDTRVKILKSLRERRKTLSEIADEQKMSVSGIKEHLETLENAGLITKLDDGHKWKYYELTKKGNQIVAPKELKVWIVLSISLLLFVGSMFILFGMINSNSVPEPSTQQLNRPMVMAPMNTMEANITASANQNVEESNQVPNFALLIAAISGISLLGSIGILIKNRMQN